MGSDSIDSYVKLNAKAEVSPYKGGNRNLHLHKNKRFDYYLAG